MVWSKGKTLADKRIICKKIIVFLLKAKFNIFKKHYLYVADQMEDLLKLHNVISQLLLNIIIFNKNASFVSIIIFFKYYIIRDYILLFSTK